MRPKSVRLGEQVYFASIIVIIAAAIVGWNASVAANGVALALGVNAFAVGLSLLLLVLTTRNASRLALWGLSVLTAIGVAGFFWQVANGVVAMGWIGVLTTLQALLSVVGIVMLFSPTAQAWFAGAPEESVSL